MPVAKKVPPSEHHIISDEIYVNTSSSSVSNGVLVFVLLLVLAVNSLILYFVMWYTLSLTNKEGDDIGIKKVLLDLEYEKVGWKGNYDILQKYSQMQIKEQISKIEQYVNGEGANPQNIAPTEKTAPTGTLTPEEVKKILDDASIEGNKQASIIAIEYSDMECPFCMKQYHDTKLFPELLAQYEDKISVAFKNNRWVNHRWTEAKAIGALCAGKIGGDSAYQKFYKGVMDKSTSNDVLFNVADLWSLAKTLWLDVTKWQSCVDSKETLARFTAQTIEAQKLWLGGTPGTLVLNTKTGKYATIEWAYPIASFTAKIDELLR